MSCGPSLGWSSFVHHQLFRSVLPPCFSPGTCPSDVPLWLVFVLPSSHSLSPMTSLWCFSTLSSPHFPYPMAPPRWLVWCKLKEGPGRRQYSADFCSFSSSGDLLSRKGKKSVGNGPGGFGDSCLVLFWLLVRTGSDFSRPTHFFGNTSIQLSMVFGHRCQHLIYQEIWL